MRRIALFAASALLLAACGQAGIELGAEPEDPAPEETVEEHETDGLVGEENEEAAEDDEAVEEEDPCEDPPTGEDLIIVSEPESGDTVTSPFTVTGCSSTFEANVLWQLLDADGNVLAEDFTMGGTMGEPADFTFEVAYTVTEQQEGTLRVYEESAKDGSELHLNEVTLTLQP
jgi:hypothetical protein